MDKHLSFGVEDKDRKCSMKFCGEEMALFLFFISYNAIIPVYKHQDISHYTPSLGLPVKPAIAFFSNTSFGTTLFTSPIRLALFKESPSSRELAAPMCPLSGGR
jgi:hypothetical protein